MPSTSTHPMTLPSGTRRRVVKEHSLNKVVPLLTANPKGEVLQGLIRVPLRLARTQEHTNERLEFDKLIRENLERWASWRLQRGWEITEKPRVRGPFNPPNSDRLKTIKFTRRMEKVLGKSGKVNPVTSFDHAEEVLWYFARARFKRIIPQYISLEDMLELNKMHRDYGIEQDKDILPWTILPDAVAEMDAGDAPDPMAFAEQLRQSHGHDRKDYLMGDIRKPL